LPIEAVSSAQEIPVLIKVDDEVISSSTVTVQPITKRDIYLLSYSHNDIGYTDLQPNIERKQWSHIDQALELIKKTQNYPFEARYKWNMEVLWALESYLKQAPEEKRTEVINAIRDGYIGLNALYANVLTGLANSTEMTHFLDFARQFSQSHNIPITTALVSDIPGFTWGIVTALAQSGVKYFASAPNPFDRIGYTLETWGDKPFYWTSQSGEEKILTWVAGASYASFHEGEMIRVGENKIMKLMRKLDENNYPYNIVHLPYTIGGDNGPPDPNLSDFVKQWNEKYVSPRMIIATHGEMFREFEQHYGAILPSFSGDFTPYWEDGAASTALETALNRNAVDRLIQSEALWSLLAPHNFPEREHAAAWRNVVFYDEHTWGAHNSVSEPDLPFVKNQWKIKREFARMADSLSRELLSQAVRPTIQPSSTETALDVYNTNSWTRTDVLIVSTELSTTGDLVVDEQGKRLPSQRLSTGELAFLAKDVPPLSAKRFYIKKGKTEIKGSAKAAGNSLENDLALLTINKLTGAIERFVWKKKDIQLVDGSKNSGLNEYFYVAGKDPEHAQHLTNVKIRVKEQGRLFASLLIEADAPGCKRFSSEIRLIDGLDRVDVINALDKEAVRKKEGVHFAFPFRVPQGQLRYDVASGIVKPEEDQLSGSCKNFFSVQSFVDISNNDYGVTWATVDAPLMEIGDIHAEAPWMKTIEPSQTFYSYVMNNYWHTNFKAAQEGLVWFRYSIQPHEKYHSDAAVRFGIEQRQPLIVALAGAASKPAPSLFQLQPSSVIATSIKPVENGRAWLLHFYNPTGQSQFTQLHWNEPMPVRFFRSNSFGKAGDRIEDGFTLPAFGSRIIRIEKQ
jgi:alpha-mannosidase